MLIIYKYCQKEIMLEYCLPFTVFLVSSEGKDVGSSTGLGRAKIRDGNYLEILRQSFYDSITLIASK